ncbi:MAG: Mov34/MPN/PAD-1 family protein [Candidatus Riflebacteria bacterium]|nr:Mov34/MPN/PAD-1 family protein [Candidatus Riflebacteria bacterium]
MSNKKNTNNNTDKNLDKRKVENADVKANSGNDSRIPVNADECIKLPFPSKIDLEYRVRIEKAAYDKIVLHSAENVKVELCGVLIGRTGIDDLGTYLLIDDMIRAEGSKNEGAQVTFTHTSWDYIHSELEKRGSGKIIGWYHTHPGFGIFLSDMDKFIHDYFFNQPFQVAFVYDPIAKTEGLFAWISGAIKPLNKWWVGDNQRTLQQGSVGNEPIKLLSDSKYSSKLEEIRRGPPEITDWWRIATIISAFCLGMLISTFTFRMNSETAFKEAARAEFRSLFASLGGLYAESSDLQIIGNRIESTISKLNSSECQTDAVKTELQASLELVSSFSATLKDREMKLMNLISGRAGDPIPVFQKIPIIEQQIMQIRNILAEVYLFEVKNLLMNNGSNGNTGNENLSSDESGRKTALKIKAYYQLAIALNPMIEERFKSEFPGVFSNSSGE